MTKHRPKQTFSFRFFLSVCLCGCLLTFCGKLSSVCRCFESVCCHFLSLCGHFIHLWSFGFPISYFMYTDWPVPCSLLLIIHLQSDPPSVCLSNLTLLLSSRLVSHLFFSPLFCLSVFLSSNCKTQKRENWDTERMRAVCLSWWK